MSRSASPQQQFLWSHQSIDLRLSPFTPNSVYEEAKALSISSKHLGVRLKLRSEVIGRSVTEASVAYSISQEISLSLKEMATDSQDTSTTLKQFMDYIGYLPTNPDMALDLSVRVSKLNERIVKRSRPMCEETNNIIKYCNSFNEIAAVPANISIATFSEIFTEANRICIEAEKVVNQAQMLISKSKVEPSWFFTEEVMTMILYITYYIANISGCIYFMSNIRRGISFNASIISWDIIDVITYLYNYYLCFDMTKKTMSGNEFHCHWGTIKGPYYCAFSLVTLFCLTIIIALFVQISGPVVMKELAPYDEYNLMYLIRIVLHDQDTWIFLYILKEYAPFKFNPFKNHSTFQLPETVNMSDWSEKEKNDYTARGKYFFPRLTLMVIVVSFVSLRIKDTNSENYLISSVYNLFAFHWCSYITKNIGNNHMGVATGFGPIQGPINMLAANAGCVAILFLSIYRKIR
ncbi:hypothetical protein CAAN3_05S00650 [[Candida] anglica]